MPDVTTEHAARRAAKRAARIVGIEVPEIRWASLDRGTHGEVSTLGGRHIVLDEKLSAGKAMLTAAHETRHLWHVKTKQFDVATDKAEMEADARSFEKWALRRLADEAGGWDWFKEAVASCEEIDFL